jgi:hypothetical protein
MTFNEKVNQMKNKIFKLISTNEITYLKDLDTRIKLNKYGKFSYFKIYEIRNQSRIWNFINELEDGCVYTIIPIISANNNSDEPYIILSKQILVTNKSNSLEIWKFINNKIIDMNILYNTTVTDKILIFKFKKVKIDFLEINSFR